MDPGAYHWRSMRECLVLGMPLRLVGVCWYLQVELSWWFLGVECSLVGWEPGLSTQLGQVDIGSSSRWACYSNPQRNKLCHQSSQYRRLRNLSANPANFRIKRKKLIWGKKIVYSHCPHNATCPIVGRANNKTEAKRTPTIEESLSNWRWIRTGFCWSR